MTRPDGQMTRMTRRPDEPRASIGRVLDDLGGTLLELASDYVESAATIDGILVYDQFDEPAWLGAALVLGIGLGEPAEIVEALGVLGAHDAAGLVLRSPVPTEPEIELAATRNRVAVFGFTRGASWVQLISILQSMLVRDDFGDPAGERLGKVPFGDLFAVANAVAALLDAPVTIEDLNSRVLAFSSGQDEADAARIETILGRRVPEPTTRELREQGVFRELRKSERPLFIEASSQVSDGFTQPRVALAIRAGNEVLGSIWAAVHAPPSDDLMDAFRDVGKLVALHLLSHRAVADIERRLRAELISTVLEGGTGASDAARQLSLAKQPAIVLALTLPPLDPQRDSMDVDRLADCEHVADAFAVHLTAAYPGSVVALLGDIAYGIVPIGRAPMAAERAMRLAKGFLERMGTRTTALIGIGSIAGDPSDLPRSRDDADRTLRVLASDDVEPRVACIAEVSVDALVMELSDLCAARGERASGAVARLLEYDAKHRTFLVDSLRAWLDALGDVNAASRAVHVHPNTFRYRLRRVAEVGEFDLNDPDARFGAILQLRMLVRR